jgi:hypothetical protein
MYPMRIDGNSTLLKGADINDTLLGVQTLKRGKRAGRRNETRCRSRLRLPMHRRRAAKLHESEVCDSNSKCCQAGIGVTA